MTEIRCLECEHLRLQGCDMAAHGFGHCKFDEVWRYRSPAVARYCEKFRPVSADAALSREMWLEKRAIRIYVLKSS